MTGHEYLIDVILNDETYQEMSSEEKVHDDRGCRLFVREWNRRYPGYPVRRIFSPHDFGSYPSVVMQEELFVEGLAPGKVFPNGIEHAATDLADELGLEC